MKKRREFIINNLMINDFAVWESGKISLKEKEKSGKSILNLNLHENEIISIKDYDDKVNIGFFDTENHMKKKVDHVLFECINENENKWILHLIEFKTSVGNRTWEGIKGKFRASYLSARGIAAMLEINVVETRMYTTYETDKFYSDTVPTSRRVSIGIPLSDPIKEWNGGYVELNFGDKLCFSHTPLKMNRNEENYLENTYEMNKSIYQS